ncbi:MAG: D-alanyl-D-alanine carboxypeptidase family protein, partial [Caulobacteraceae bacterium]
MLHSARRLFTAAGLVLSMATGVMGMATATPAAALGVFSQPKYAAIVVDANSGEVLYSKNADALRHPASITKIMTLYLTFEALSTGRLSLNDVITISPHAYSMMPSKVSTHPGETLTVAEAIPAMTVHSANDVAVAMAERIGGSESHFAQLMTLRARELGMTSTRFVNASGLPPDGQQISTARDIAILSRAAMRDYPQYYHFFGLKSFDFHGKVLMNHNHLVARMPGVDGMKTGYTSLAGFNLVASAVRDNHRLITVVLGGPSTAARDENVEELLDAGFAVINRRATGQRITIASLISEPDDMRGPLERPPIEEGSADQAGLQVEVQPQVRTMPVMAAAQALSEEPKRETARAEREAAQAEKTAAADCAPA